MRIIEFGQRIYYGIYTPGLTSCGPQTFGSYLELKYVTLEESIEGLEIKV